MKDRNSILLPETSATLTELHQRALDFARRAIFKGYSHLTKPRQEKLWSDAQWFLGDCFEDGIHDWDQEKGLGNGMYACDWFMERFEYRYLPNTTRWNRKFEQGEYPAYLNILMYVCRSAIDLVDDWAGMCIGWTLGDFKRMYDGELPSWFPCDGWNYFADGPAPPVSEWDDTTKICV